MSPLLLQLLVMLLSLLVMLAAAGPMLCDTDADCNPPHSVCREKMINQQYLDVCVFG